MQIFYDSSLAKDGARTAARSYAAAFLFLTTILFASFSHATMPVGPTAPSNLIATAISNSRIDLSWTDNAGDETGFKIEVKLGAAGAYSQIGTVGANVASFSSTGLDASTDYFYRVRAYNAGGNSSYSNEAGATTLPDPPAAPSNLTATVISNSQINLAWTDNASNESGYKVERKLTSAVTYTLIATLGPNTTSYASTGLAADKNYSYRVYAYNNGGSSAYSNVATATTLPNPPVAPSGLAASAASFNQIDLSWTDNATNEAGFIIERKTGAGGVYAVIDSIGANTTLYSSTGLEGSTQYYFRVRAYNTGGNSTYSNEANATTLPNPPSPPSNLTATAVSNEQVDLAWTDNSSSEDGFKIEIKIGAAGEYTEVAIVGADVTNYSSVGLEASTEYFCRVRAYNAGGNSDYANEASATTFPDAPVAPSSLGAVTISDTQIDLSWTDNSGTEDGFKIERKLAAAVSYTQIATVGPNVTSFSSTGLSANTAYSYRVRAHNVSGNSSYSNVASATTLISPPTAPSNLTAANAGKTQINLAWSDNANNETGYSLERKLAGDSAYIEIIALGANTASYSNTGLTPGTQYFYRVRAVNSTGPSAYSNEANATTTPNAPSAPSLLSATPASNTQIDLAWTDNASNETGFKIERKTGAAGTYAQIGTVGANVTTFSNAGLTPLTQYFYRVRANNTGGNSAYSNEANATTFPNPPQAPGNLTATTSSNVQIDLAWADSSSNEDGFKIERRLAGDTTFAEIATLGPNVTSYSNTDLSANTQYFYRVRAFNTGNHSAYSNEANATTLPNIPNKPGSLIATTVSKSRIDLAWADSSDNEGGFKIERKTGAAGTYAEIGTVGPNVASYSNTGLGANTKYFYRVRAFNAGGNSGYSNEANATTLPNAPKAPGGLSATTMSSAQINLAWVDSSANETGFKIERKTGAAGTYAQVATVGANVTSFANTALDPDTQYFYRVRANNTGGNSLYSNEANATTYPLLPGAPGNLIATTMSNTQINLAWADSAVNEDGFKIERKLGVAGTFAEVEQVAANVTSYANTGLNPNTEYFYRVRAFNGGGHSPFSNEANAATLPNAPGAPVNLTATTFSNTQINLAWADSASNEDGFKIERKQGAAGEFAQIDQVGPNVTSYSNTGLNANTEYFYRVRAFNAGGHSSFSNEANATTLPHLPGAPVNLTATTISNTQINLAWADSASNEDGFKLERKIAGGAYAQIKLLGPNVTTFSNTGLNANTQYFYRVRAYNAGGNSSFSNEANATTLPDAPGTPGNLTATAISKSQINLAWADSASNEDGLKIERKTGAAGTFAEIGTVGPNVTSYSNTGLGANTQYFYRVRAHNAGGHSAFSNEAGAKTLPNAPKAPGNLAATTFSNVQINLAWADSASNESGFKIECKTGAAGTFAQIGAVGANVTTFASTGLNPNTEYFYRVRAHNAGGNSVYSNAANATTLPNAPNAPVNLTATTMGSAQINLAWVDSSNNENGFKIERKTGVAGTYAQIGTVGPNVTAFSNTGLTPNTQYFYRVRSHNAGGNSPFSNEANATTLPTIPKAPGNLSATAINSGKIDLAWADSSSNEDGFKIERKTGAAGAYAQIATVGANITSYSNTGLSPTTQYFYRVRSHNPGGHSPFSNEANATTLPTIPKAPGNLSATAINHAQINLAWADSSNNESGFKIERKTGAAGTYAQIATVGANVTSYNNTGLNPSTQYFYRVRAYNAGGNSSFSNEANATTTPTIPKAPGNLSATAINHSQINLAWADSSSNEDGFKIERKTGAAGTYAQIGTVGANVTTYSNTGLSENTQYFYRVRAHNAGGHSAYTNQANATTPIKTPKAPGNLTATAMSNSQINLAWSDSSNNETGFKLERKTGSGGTYAEVALLGANVTTYSNTGLAANATYYYRVRAYNGGGNSTYSNAANAKTLPNKPKAPGNLSAGAVSTTRINLAWKDSSNNETGFKIERKIGSGGTYAQIGTTAQNVVSYADSGLISGTEYFYRVRAYNTGGNSNYSNQASATTAPTAPPAPSGLSASAISGAQIYLAWTDNALNESGFKIERKTGAAGTYAQIATVSANVTSFSNTGLNASTQYYYRVRAYNGGGNSTFSNEANATTLSNSANLALNKPATALNTDSTSSPSNGVDGNAATYWRSGFVNAGNPISWLRVELHPVTSLLIGRAVVTWNQDYYAEQYELQVSTDGAAWTTVFTNNAGALGTQNFTFTPVLAKFVRLYLKKNSKSNYRVIALEIYTGSEAAPKNAEDEGEAASLPKNIALEQNYPNPFNPSTQIRYALPEAAHVTLTVFNALGQEVRRLVHREQPAGFHVVTWNGRDRSGNHVPSGVYHYRLQVGEHVTTKRMTLAK